jgi:hypothetical protein
MRKAITLISAIALALAISGCSADEGTNPSPGGSTSITTPDPSLIPAQPGTEIKAIDPSLFDVGFSEFLFKVGDGPVWCTINADEKWALCEQNEAAAEYAPVPTPADCEGSYGYQIKLYEDSSTSTLADGAAAGFMCSGGYYSDSSVAQTLNTGESVTVGNIKCYVNDITARCDNTNGQYIALGPKVWAAKN